MSQENGDHIVSIHYIICECGDTFPSEDALRTHLEKEHPHKREKKEYKCGICSAIYSLEESCIKHYEETHMSDDQDTESGEAESSYALMDTSDELVQNSVEFREDNLEECQYDDNDLEEVEIPLEVSLEDAIDAVKLDDLEEGEIKLEAGESPELMGPPQELPPRPAKKKRGRKIVPKTEPDPELMFVIQHGEKKGKLVSMLKKSGRLPKGARTCSCEVCGKLYASHAALRYHQRTHTGERPYQCTLCPKAFTMPLFLQIHTRTHTGERPYQCLSCPKAFSNKAALLRHDRVHTGEKPYSCPMCAKTFTQSNSMKLHVTTVHLKQPTPYKSKNRRLKEEERLQTKKKIIPNPRKKVPVHLDSVEILKNGLESYVLGPLKADMDNLKTDIDMLARGEFEDEINAVETIDTKEEEEKNFEVTEEILYEDDSAGQYEVVLSDIN